MHVQRCFPELCFSKRCALQKEPGRCSSFRFHPFLSHPSEECSHLSDLLCDPHIPVLGAGNSDPSTVPVWDGPCVGNHYCVYLGVSADSLLLSELG